MRIAKTRKFWLLAAALVCFSGGTQLAVPWSEAYRVNVSSFQSGGFAPLVGDPLRAIQYAAQHWAAYAGSARLYGLAGTTSQQDCDIWGNSLVMGVPTIPGADNCEVQADSWACPVGGGFRIRIAGCAGPTFTVPGSGVVPCMNPAGCSDFHSLLVHEFGHRVLPSGPGVWDPVKNEWTHHLPGWTNWDDPYLMSDAMASAPGAGLGVVELFTGFGSLEVEAVGGPGVGASVWGIGFMSSELSSASSVGYPNPTDFASPALSGRMSGIGGFDYQAGLFLGADRKLVATSNPSSAVHESQTRNLTGATGPSSTSSRHLSRPSLVYDTLRQQWWMLSRDANHNNYVHLFKGLASSGALVWQDLGAIPDIITRVQVGATYDPLTDQIVVVWLSGRGDTRQVPRTGFDCTTRPAFAGGGTQPFGCQAEYLVTVLRASDGARLSTSRFLTASGPGKHGFIGLGSPAVVCEASGLPYWGFPQCQAFVTSKTAAREILTWRFQVLYGGSGVGAYTDQVPIGGQTDFPISVSTQPASSDARVVLSVIGSGDRRVYFTSRQCPACPWNGWASPWSNMARTEAIIRRDPTFGSYTLVVGLE